MNIDLQLKFKKEKFDGDKGNYVCFKHAAKRALLGENIETEIDDYSSEYDMRDTSCGDCLEYK